MAINSNSSSPAALFVLTNSALNRGMNTGLENLAWGLAERGLEVHILCGGSPAESHNYCFPGNVRYHFTGESAEDPASFLPLFRQIAQKHKIGIVIGWIINTALLAREPGAKEISFYANLGQMPPRSFLLRFLKAALLGKMKIFDAIKLILAISRYPKVSRAVVSISQATQDASIEAYGLENKKCMVVPRGIDTEIYAYNERGKETGSPVEVLFAGNIHDAKGIGELTTAIETIKTPLLLRLCGRAQQDYLDTIRAKVEGSGHQLAYMGPTKQSDLVRYFQKCDIFVFPSHREGLGKALIEAMSCGCPVVCSDIPTFKEIVQNNHNGLMVPVRKAEAIAGAIERYINNPSLRKQCSENARKTAEERFSKQREVDSWVRILQHVD